MKRSSTDEETWKTKAFDALDLCADELKMGRAQKGGRDFSYEVLYERWRECALGKLHLLWSNTRLLHKFYRLIKMVGAARTPAIRPASKRA